MPKNRKRRPSRQHRYQRRDDPEMAMTMTQDQWRTVLITWPYLSDEARLVAVAIWTDAGPDSPYSAREIVAILDDPHARQIVLDRLNRRN